MNSGKVFVGIAKNGVAPWVEIRDYTGFIPINFFGDLTDYLQNTQSSITPPIGFKI